MNIAKCMRMGTLTLVFKSLVALHSHELVRLSEFKRSSKDECQYPWKCVFLFHTYQENIVFLVTNLAHESFVTPGPFYNTN